jgi:hypothetical protein
MACRVTQLSHVPAAVHLLHLTHCSSTHCSAGTHSSAYTHRVHTARIAHTAQVHTARRVQDRLPPVRVKLQRADAYTEQTCPPGGEVEAWEARLNKALGTVSPDFVKTSLLQLQGAARSPFGTVSETAINAALAMIEAAAPRDEIEGALAVQMACTHAAAMAVLAKLDSGFGTERRIAALGSTAARLLKTFAMQVEVLRRLRHGGQQFVRVEHVHVNDGGQALIGNVKKSDR